MTTKITTDNILDGTIDAVDMKDLAITNAKLAGSIDVTSKLTGSVPTTNLPTIPVSKGGTGLTSLGSAEQALKVNSGASALEFGSAGSNILQMVTTSSLSNVSTTSNVTTYQTCGNFGPITPKSDTSHIIAVWGGWWYPYLTSGSNAGLGMGMRLTTDFGGSTTVGVTGTGNNAIFQIQANSMGWLHYALQYVQNVFKTSSDAGHPGAGNPVTYYPWISLSTTSATPSMRITYQTSYIMEIEPAS